MAGRSTPGRSAARSTAWRTAVAAAGIVLVVAGCGTSDDDDDTVGGAGTPAAAEQSGSDVPSDDPAADSELPDAGLEDIPDPVAAVNGTDISREEFLAVYSGQYQQQAMQSQSSGQPVDEEAVKKVAADGLVGALLLEQEATARGMKVSEAEIDAELERYAETNQVSVDEFVSAMGEQGLDRQGVRDQIVSQKLVEKLVVAEYGEPEITDAQIEAAYERVAQAQAMQGGGQAGGQIPPLEKVRDQIAEQLRAEQLATGMETLSQELRKGADVVVFL